MSATLAADGLDSPLHHNWLEPEAVRNLRTWTPEDRYDWTLLQELGPAAWALLTILSPHGLDGRP